MHLLARELQILKSLNHPNIIRFYETYQDDNFFHIVMEFCNGGDLTSRLAEKKIFGEYESRKLMTKLFSAVKYLHE